MPVRKKITSWKIFLLSKKDLFTIIGRVWEERLMNLLFLSLHDFQSIKERGIYTDLLREFAHMGHNIYIVSPFEKKIAGLSGLVKEEENVSILKVRIGNTQKTNLIEKGISTLLLEFQIKAAIEKYWSNVCFDLILYATPPITFERVIRHVIENTKWRFGKRPITYLMLKDIFPQNAVDLGMFQKDSPIYAYFRLKEKRLYRISDYIGCMSPENCRYLLRHNPQINRERVEVLPNSVKPVKPVNESEDKRTREMVNKALVASRKKMLRDKYNIPEDALVFLYGGNLGKPQDVDYIIRCLRENEGKADRFFLICGSGTQYDKLYRYYEEAKLGKNCNFALEPMLPREEYDMLPAACDVGLIFLDYRFTIPNFPSRLLSYMEAGIPVLAATDRSTDIGRLITKNGFGFWCESSRAENFTTEVEKIIAGKEKLPLMGEKGRAYLLGHFTTDIYAQRIIDKMKKGR